VQDLVALLDVLVSPAHDLSLAQALRSPLFGLDDAALARLAQHHGLSRRELLERLVLAADEGIASGLAPDSVEWATYFKVTQ